MGRWHYIFNERSRLFRCTIVVPSVDSWNTPRITPANSFIWRGCQVQRCLESLCLFLACRSLTERVTAGCRTASRSSPSDPPMLPRLQWQSTEGSKIQSVRMRKQKLFVVHVSLKMTVKTGVAAVEKQRAGGTADVCSPHYCHRIAVTFGVESYTRAQASGDPGCQIRWGQI